MLLEIKKYPDPVLRKKTQDVDKITPEIREMISDMTETMLKKDGVGLAAPQVGISKKIIVIKLETPKVFINPIITNKSKETDIMEEGCLSFPKFFLKIKRPKKIELIALDENGKKIEITAEGLMARVLQHETDHVNGILFVDRAGILQKIKAFIKFRIR